MDDVKNNLFENMLRRNLQALNILKLLLWSKQNYNKNDQQWEKKKKWNWKKRIQRSGSTQLLPLVSKTVLTFL